jgi:WD40 repeat protein
VIVVLEKKVYVYNFSNLCLIDSIETTVNQLGLITVSYDNNECVLACPDKERGKVRVKIYSKEGDSVEQNNTIDAHNSQLSCLTINYWGTLLATASEKGTIIRLFNPQTGEAL